MLHKDKFTVEPATFELIQKLQALPDLKEFLLVGGTSLALQLNHRNSIDIDLFTQNTFQNDKLINYIIANGFKIDRAYGS